MAGEIVQMMQAEPPARPLYRLSVNVSGDGFDIDVTVDGVTRIGPGLHRAVLAVLDAAVAATCADDDETDGGSDGEH